MVWGASWDPTGRYSTMEPSVSTFRGSLKLSEVGLAAKKGWKWGEKSIKLFALKRCYTHSKLVGNWRLWKIESKHAQKLTISRFLSPFFSLNYVFFSHILSLYVFRRPALKTLKSCAEFDVGRFFWRILANVSPWFFQRKSLRFWEMAKTLDRVKKS